MIKEINNLRKTYYQDKGNLQLNLIDRLNLNKCHLAEKNNKIYRLNNQNN